MLAVATAARPPEALVELLVILDGAAQPNGGPAPTALQSTRMPTLAALARDGAVARVATTPGGLAAGSETCIPNLLGAAPCGPVGRGRVDAAARRINVPDGLIPWRADVRHPDGSRATGEEARAVAARLPLPAHPIGGHRLLLLAAARPEVAVRLDGLELHVWRDGGVPEGPLPVPTVLICGPGAAAGCGRLLGARVVVPPGATGDVDTDLGAKRAAAAAAVGEGAPRVVVHVGGPDEAAHRRDGAAVIAVLERIDAELLAPLAGLAAERRGRIAVCPDHGTDPRTGRHDPAPVPAARWGEGIAPDGPDRCDEAAVAALEPVEPAWLFEPVAAPAVVVAA